MKRLTAILCLSALLLSLVGCSSFGSGSKDTVVFYYPRKQFRYGSEDGVIAAETRDLSNHADDLTFLLKMYLLGPLDDALDTPFPKNTVLLSREEEEGVLVITLSDTGTQMEPVRYTLACACLAKTCSEKTGIHQITVIRGSQSLTIDDANLLLLDDSSAP